MRVRSRRTRHISFHTTDESDHRVAGCVRERLWSAPRGARESSLRRPGVTSGGAFSGPPRSATPRIGRETGPQS